MTALQSKYTVIFLGVFVIVVSTVVMLGWFLDIDLFKSILPGWVTMKYSTALTFFVSGLLLVGMAYSRPEMLGVPQILLPIFSLLIFLFMATLLLGVLLGFQTGIELIVKEDPNAVASSAPGRPSVGTMASFLLIALSGTVDSFLKQSTARVFHTLSSRALIFIGGVALIGYVVSFPALYYFIEGVSSAMAIHTAILFVVIGAGLHFLVRMRT